MLVTVAVMLGSDELVISGDLLGAEVRVIAIEVSDEEDAGEIAVDKVEVDVELVTVLLNADVALMLASVLVARVIVDNGMVAEESVLVPTVVAVVTNVPVEEGTVPNVLSKFVADDMGMELVAVLVGTVVGNVLISVDMFVAIEAGLVLPGLVSNAAVLLDSTVVTETAFIVLFNTMLAVAEDVPSVVPILAIDDVDTLVEPAEVKDEPLVP